MGTVAVPRKGTFGISSMFIRIDSWVYGIDLRNLFRMDIVEFAVPKKYVQMTQE